VHEFLRALKAAGYMGPVGLQCHAVKGGQKENLRTSMAAWEESMSRLQAEGAGP
jgi:hypothetical protein